MNNQISCADISSEERREDYLQHGEQVEAAHTPGQSIEELLEDVPPGDPVLPPSDPLPVPWKQKKAHAEPKCSYVQTTKEQQDELEDLFRQYGRTMSAKWYHEQSGIPLHNCQNLLTRLRKGQNLTPLRIQQGRTRILQPEHTQLILAYIKDKTEATLQELVCVVTEYEEGKVHAAAGVEEQFVGDQDDEG